MTFATVAMTLFMLTSPVRIVPATEEPAATAKAAASLPLCSPGRVAVARQAEAAAHHVKAVAGLPQSYGKSFRTLDAYLIHLECFAAPVDGPWYRQVRPGVYELQTGNLRVVGVEPEKRTYTRAQLAKKFGFTN